MKEPTERSKKWFRRFKTYRWAEAEKVAAEKRLGQAEAVKITLKQEVKGLKAEMSEMTLQPRYDPELNSPAKNEAMETPDTFELTDLEKEAVRSAKNHKHIYPKYAPVWANMKKRFPALPPAITKFKITQRRDGQVEQIRVEWDLPWNNRGVAIGLFKEDKRIAGYALGDTHISKGHFMTFVSEDHTGKRTRNVSLADLRGKVRIGAVAFYNPQGLFEKRSSTAFSKPIVFSKDMPFNKWIDL